ncbi:hypothetical protein FRC10_007937 [Ceratobasidium sp. 414]|nr:hypothetical protein FRC10_007937 [Ceratobasidium sp. 414]
MAIKVVKSTYALDAAPPKVLPELAHELLFQNVTSFSLYGGYFDWDSAAFKGLEHLQLVGLGSRPSPTLGQIVGILRSSPGLRTLGLGNMRLQPDEYAEDVPIHFEYLHKLSLMSLVEPDLSKLLPLISPGPQMLTVHMNYELIPGPAADAYVELFRRSKIESIYFHARISRNTMSDVFASLPHLRFLYLSRNRYLSNILRALTAPQPTPTNEATGEAINEVTTEVEPPRIDVPCPLLHTIHMNDCKFKIPGGLLGQPITNQPKLTIKLQLCDPPDLADIFLQGLVGLVSGQVFLEKLEASEPLSDVPFYGLNRTNTFTLNKRMQVENIA